MMICGLPLSRSFAFFEARAGTPACRGRRCLHVPAERLETLAGVLALRGRGHRVERHVVRIVNQDEVIEPEVPGERDGLHATRLPACSRRPRDR